MSSLQSSSKKRRMELYDRDAIDTSGVANQLLQQYNRPTTTPMPSKASVATTTAYTAVVYGTVTTAASRDDDVEGGTDITDGTATEPERVSTETIHSTNNHAVTVVDLVNDTPTVVATPRRIQITSYCLGLVIGVFIQFSSLAANFLGASSLTVSLLWSVATSTVGVLVLLTLRLLALTTNTSTSGSSSTTTPSTAMLTTTMMMTTAMATLVECAFAAGALTGVCAAWMGTDVLLGLPLEARHSLGTLCVAVAACGVVVYSSSTTTCRRSPSSFTSTLMICEEDAERGGLEYPLLSHDNNNNEIDNDIPSSNRWTKVCSLLLGCWIGLFIQFGSLGANFLFQQYSDMTTAATANEDTEHVDPTSVLYDDWIVTASLVWSIVTSCMGIAVLLLIRDILAGTWTLTTTPATTTAADQTKAMFAPWIDNAIVTVECYFAFGAVLGLNMAWTATDIVLGLETHVWSSLATLVATLVWCQSVLSVCGYVSRKCVDNEYVEEEMTKAVYLLTDGDEENDTHQGIVLVV